MLLCVLLCNRATSKEVIIQGNVKNPPKGARVQVLCFNNKIEWDQITVADAAIDKQGNFSLRFAWDKSTSARLNILEQITDLFLVPGDSMNLTVDYEHFDETIQYTGKGAADNNYLAAEVVNDFQTLSLMSRGYEPFTAFQHYIDSIEQLNLNFFKAHYSPDFSPEFLNEITTTLKYRYITAWYDYPTKFDKKTNAFVKRIVPDTFYNFMKKINLEEAVFDNNIYLVAVAHYCYQEADVKLKLSDTLPVLLKHELLIENNIAFMKNNLKGNVLDYQLTYYLKRQITLVAEDEKKSKEILQEYNAICKNKTYTDIINKIYENALRLKAGSIAPALSLIGLDGKTVALSSLKGKVVLIDFWATWCSPCKASMPATHQLFEQFKDRNDFVLLCVNVSDNQTSWNTFILKEKLPGLHLFADEKQSKRLYKDYNFDGIPHFVLIDKEGKMVDAAADNGEKTTSKIKKALEQ
jgi:thiol-disulfide isomerase/thioredoxin